MSLSTIQASLGLNTSDFSAKAKAAEKDLKQFSEGVGNIGKVFSAGGTITAVMGFFNGVIAAARDSKDALDENVQAVRRFGDSFDQAKSWTTDFSIASVGVLNRVGEAAGTALKGLMALSRGRLDAHFAEESVLASTERAAGEAEANLAAALVHQKEYAAVTAGLAKIEAERASARAKSLTDEEKIAVFQNAAAAAAERVNDATLTTLERRQAMLSLRQAEVGLEDALAAAEAARRATSEKQFEAEHKASMARLTADERVAELTADIAMREKLIADGIWTGVEAERARAIIASRKLELTETENKLQDENKETQKVLIGYAEEKLKKARKLLSIDDQITAVNNERVKLEKLVNDTKGRGKENTEAVIKLYEKQNELAGLLAEKQKIIADETKREADARKAAAEEFRKITPTTGRKTGFNTTGKDYKDQETVDLADVLDNLRQQRTDQNVQYQKAISPGEQFSAGFILDFIDGQIRQVEAEIRARKDYQRKVDVFGPEVARDFIGGQEFNRLKDILGPNNDTKRTADTLGEINSRLRRAGFST